MAAERQGRPRWTGTWLSDPTAGVSLRRDGAYRGSRLGLPEHGPGSVATFGRRLAAFVLDLVIGGLIGAVIVSVVGGVAADARDLVATAAFAAELLVLTALTGASLGMRLAGLRVAHLAHREGLPGFLPAAVRTLLLCTLIPALIMDRDGRGLHDKAAGTVVLNA